MPNRRKAPGREWIASKIAQGLSDQQIADRWFEETGELVTRQAINKIVRMHDLRPHWKQHADVIPWKVQGRHSGHYYHKILYAEARRRKGQPLSPDWAAKLESFKRKLKERNAVIAYVPDSPKGFYLVKALPGEELITTRGLDE